MYQIPDLSQQKGLFHAFSTKDEGNMANAILGQVTNFKRVVRNRQNFLKNIKVDINSCIAMWVLAEDGVVEANMKDAGVSMLDYEKAVKIDALITNNKNIHLFLLTADCAPVILYDPVKHTIGLVHVGWKGAHLNIVGKTVKKLYEKYESDPPDIIAIIGPYAHKDSFIKENPSQKEDPLWLPFIEQVDANYYKVDYAGLCKKELLDAGIKANNIIDCGINTVKDERFFSHQRDANKPLEEQGRFACVVGLR
jgi:YfiH family protein